MSLLTVEFTLSKKATENKEKVKIWQMLQLQGILVRVFSLCLHKHTEAPSKSFILHPLHFPKKVFSADSKLLMYWWKANYEPSCNCPPHRAIFFILLYLVALSLQLFELFLWIMEEYREKIKTDRLNSNK